MIANTVPRGASVDARFMSPLTPSSSTPRNQPWQAPEPFPSGEFARLEVWQESPDMTSRVVWQGCKSPTRATLMARHTLAEVTMRRTALTALLSLFVVVVPNAALATCWYDSDGEVHCCGGGR